MDARNYQDIQERASGLMIRVIVRGAEVMSKARTDSCICRETKEEECSQRWLCA